MHFRHLAPGVSCPRTLKSYFRVDFWENVSRRVRVMDRGCAPGARVRSAHRTAFGIVETLSRSLTITVALTVGGTVILGRLSFRRRSAAVT